MDNPMSNIEDKKACEDMGLMAVRVFQGALVESANTWEAFLATAGFFSGMFHPAPPPEEGDDGA